MKNLMKMAALAAVLMFSANVNAQEEFGGKKGAFGTEIDFNPFANGFNTFDLSNLGLKFRYFISDEHAVRLGLNVGLHNETTGATVTVPNAADPVYMATGTFDAIAYARDVDIYNNQKNDKTKLNETKFSVNLGYEYHFAKFGRADLYAGAQVGFGMVNYKTTSDNTTAWQYDATTGLSKWANLKSEYKGFDNVNGNKSAIAINAGVFTGIDFYVTKSIFVGAELGINFSNTKFKNYDVTMTAPAATWATDGATTTLTTKYEVTDKATELKFYVEPALRLGWKF